MLVLRLLIGAALGAAFGLAFHRFIGCRGGGCPLSGNPWLAVLTWSLFGVLFAFNSR